MENKDELQQAIAKLCELGKVLEISTLALKNLAEATAELARTVRNMESRIALLEARSDRKNILRS